MRFAGNETVFTKTTPPSPVKPAPFDVDAHELDDPKAKDNVAGNTCMPKFCLSCVQNLHYLV